VFYLLPGNGAAAGMQHCARIETMMQNDPIVEETRRVRQAIAAEFGGDAGALGEYFKAMRAADVARQLAEFLKQAPGISTGETRYDDVSANNL
jgi:hypothetical protein